MDTADRSVLRLVTDDLEPTKRVLTSLGTEFEVGEVLSVQMDNRPGGPRQGPGAARGGAHQHRIRLRLDRHGARPLSGDVPHLEPEGALQSPG